MHLPVTSDAGPTAETSGPPAADPVGVRRRVPWGAALPLAGALALWAHSVVRTDPAQLGDFGLVGALPVTYWAALALLTGGFWYCVRDPARGGGWPAAYVLGLLLLERATQALVYPTALYAWAWKHDAVVEHLLSAGRLETTAERLGDMAVHDQWPGFFAAQAGLVRLTGAESAAAFMAWWPLFSSLLLLAPLLLVYRTFTQDRGLLWTAVWLFHVANWVGQDYFSPQSLALALYLGVIAVVLRRGGRTGDGARPGGRLLWTALLLPPMAAVVVSHQLTPVMLGAGLAVLCLIRDRRVWALPALAVLAVVFLAWNLTVSLPFLREAVPEMLRSFGDVRGNLETGYGSTPTGTGPVAVSWVARLLSGAVLLLAALGVLRRTTLRTRARPLLLLTAVPLLMLVANDYGSEMIFRVLLFMLPGACFFAAAALLPPAAAGTAPDAPAAGPARGGRRRTVLAGTTLLVLTAAFVPAYAGKDRLSYFPPDEVELVRQVIDGAPPGSLVVAAHRNYPLAYASYGKVGHYWFLEDAKSHVREVLDDPAGTLARDMADVAPPGRAYFLLTRGQIAGSEMNGMLGAAELRRIERSVADSPLFERVGGNSAGVVYALRPTTGSTP